MRMGLINECDLAYSLAQCSTELIFLKIYSNPWGIYKLKAPKNQNQVAKGGKFLLKI